MMSFLTPEFLTLIGSSLTGFLFKYWAEKRQDQKELYERMIGRSKRQDESHNLAIERVGHNAGKTIRRIIVVTILFGTIMAPFILPFFGIPTVVEITEKDGSFFGFGGGESISFHEVYGYLFTEENRQVLLAIVGFYFGQAVGKHSRR
jgi:hypothetical protein|tara:strand:+ start:4502 stop:4945 length:444 start_codon:yes stop_codon:yes gene_type:complete